jgi:hypothetical protein
MCSWPIVSTVPAPSHLIDLKQQVTSASRLCAGASLATALFPKEPVVMLAANAADFIMAFFLTAPELSDWYEKGLVPWHTLATAALSLGITIFLLDRVGRQTG